MGVDAGTFRSVLGQWPSGVTVVTTIKDGWHGMTASSFSSVSLDPPLVSVCLHRDVWAHDIIDGSGVFAVNILGKDQADLGKRFAGMLKDDPATRFEGLDVLTAETGCPVFPDALGWVDCRVVYAYPGGDHTIFVGEVLAADTPKITAPLLFHSRAWGQFADQLPDDASLVDATTVGLLRERGVDEATVAAVVHALRTAGVGVHALDLTSGEPTTDQLAAVRAGGSAPVYARTGDAAGVLAAATAGAGAVDVVAADADTAAAAVRTARDHGLAVRVELPGGFAEDALDGTLAFVSSLLAGDGAAPDALLLVDDGTATPLTVRATLQEVIARSRPVPVSVRLSDEMGLGQANVLTALKSGVRGIDAALGGVGGVMAVEDVLHLLESVEVAVPADRSAVVRAAHALETTWGAPLPGRTYRLGTPAGAPAPIGGPA